LSLGTGNNSEHKEFASYTQAKSKLVKNRRRNEIDRGKFLLDLYQKALLLSEKELNDYFLDHAVSLTGSTIGDRKSVV
jgi:hypothetical protein